MATDRLPGEGRRPQASPAPMPTSCPHHIQGCHGERNGVLRRMDYVSCQAGMQLTS